MDFRQSETNQPRPAQASSATAASHDHSGHSKKRKGTGMLKMAVVSLLYACTILFVATIVYLATIRPQSQSKFVDTGRYQAVFLNGGQVYFGRITSLNNQFTRIADIYYLQVNQQVQPDQSNPSAASNNVSLVKLGCELHGPHDSMVINKDQIIFWENLKTDGKVAKAIATYKEQNPKGQNCEETQNSNSSATPSTTPKP